MWWWEEGILNLLLCAQLTLVSNSDAALPIVPSYPPRRCGFGWGTDFHTHTRTLAYPLPVPAQVSIPMSITKHQQPPLPSTETAPLPLNNSIDFEVFIILADVNNIIQFCNAAEKDEIWSFSGIVLSKQVLTKDGWSGEVGMRKGRKCISKERPRVSKKWKQLPEVPKSTSILMELRKEELRSDWNGPPLVMDPTVSHPFLFSPMQWHKLPRNYPPKPPVMLVFMPAHQSLLPQSKRQWPLIMTCQ